MNQKQPTKQKQTKQAAPKRKHDPARTEANKARRVEKDRLAKLRKAQDKADRRADHGSARFLKRAKLSFLPGPKAKAVAKALKRHSGPIHFTPERVFFQLGLRARLVEGV